MCTHTPPTKKIDKKYVWDNALKDTFVNDISSEETTSKFIEIFNVLENEVNEDTINLMVDRFTNVICEKADPLFTRSVNIKKCSYKPKSNWMSEECHKLREDFLNCLNEYRKHDTVENRLKMTSARSKYVNGARNCRHKYNVEHTAKLQKSQTNDLK
jgi:hypothetical protein